mgnify:CR=1 FL=1
MEARKLIEILKTAERLKDTARHCYTSKGRPGERGGAQLDDDSDGLFYAG